MLSCNDVHVLLVSVTCMYFHRACDSSEYSPLHGRSDLFIYAKEAKLLSTEVIMNTTLNPDLSEKQICSKVPLGVNYNLVFLVDLSKLGTSRDIVCDDMGSWKWGGSYRMWLSVDEFGDVFVRGKSKPSTLDPKLSYYRIWKRYYENKSSPDLKKIIVTVEGIRCMYTPYMLIALHMVSCLNLYCSQVLGCMSD